MREPGDDDDKPMPGYDDDGERLIPIGDVLDMIDVVRREIAIAERLDTRGRIPKGTAAAWARGEDFDGMMTVVCKRLGA